MRTMGIGCDVTVVTKDGIANGKKKLDLAIKTDESGKIVDMAVDYVAECEKQLSKHLGRGVKIVTGKKKGRFEPEYYGEEDLQVLLDALMKLEK